MSGTNDENARTNQKPAGEPTTTLDCPASEGSIWLSRPIPPAAAMPLVAAPASAVPVAANLSAAVQVSASNTPPPAPPAPPAK